MPRPKKKENPTVFYTVDDSSTGISEAEPSISMPKLDPNWAYGGPRTIEIPDIPEEDHQSTTWSNPLDSMMTNLAYSIGRDDPRVHIFHNFNLLQQFLMGFQR